MNRIAIVEDDQGYRDTLFIYIKQYEQERDTAFERHLLRKRMIFWQFITEIMILS